MPIESIGNVAVMAVKCFGLLILIAMGCAIMERLDIRERRRRHVRNKNV